MENKKRLNDYFHVEDYENKTKALLSEFKIDSCIFN